jgi:hypothetical protein
MLRENPDGSKFHSPCQTIRESKPQPSTLCVLKRGYPATSFWPPTKSGELWSVVSPVMCGKGSSLTPDSPRGVWEISETARQ